MMANTILCVLTLNCWGIPFVSKDRKARMKAIALELASGKYDIVCLQEVWSTNDFNLIRDGAKPVLPYSHYFHSGVVGSGVCILSRYPIHDVLFHQWPVNGYVHKIHHGDWFGGKGVGLCQIYYNDLLIHVYTAHLHAEYDRESDEYIAHRVLQAFDTAQFIHMTSGGADMVILGGDLNTEPDDLAYQVLLLNAYLHDAYNQPSSTDKTTFGTFATAQNSYTPTKLSRKSPNGQRIDYVLYKGGHRAQITQESYSLPLPETVPGETFSYSDHEAVMAKFKISHVGNATSGHSMDLERQSAVVQKALEICDEALARVGRHRKQYWMMSVALLLVIIAMLWVEWGIKPLVPFITAIMCYMIFMATLWNNMEVNGILAGKLGLQVTQARIQAANSNVEVPLSNV
ncbi:Putative neutral sphingomyelinase [Frankliniella fusca]|uniref:sphingomyelin phosphodiesterase n=1 Tax=Frankliniella fusca TaxID=407009 RepID=A0AAE1HUM0_9NEOP|nr:Putative neutral sphingomyelinase [Frankliniella fusca]